MICAVMGNMSLLGIKKTAFFASTTINPRSVLKCYDWATAQREAKNCVVSGFDSKLEQDVLHFLLKGTQPVILVLGCALYREVPEQFRVPFQTGRLLVVSPVEQTIIQQSRQSILERNEYIVKTADSVVFASLSKKSALWPLYTQTKTSGKPVTVL